MLTRGFLMTTTNYDNLKRVIARDLAQLEATIPKEERTPDRFVFEFKQKHNVNDKAALPSYAQELVKCLVPVPIRHMLVYSKNCYLSSLVNKQKTRRNSARISPPVF
jgi:hypothetical protein